MKTSKLLILQYAGRPVSSRHLASRIGVTRNSITRHIAELRAQKLIHIAAWTKSGNQAVPLYVAGQGTDAAKPAPMTREQYTARYRAKNPHKNLVIAASPWDPLMRRGVLAIPKHHKEHQ